MKFRYIILYSILLSLGCHNIGSDTTPADMYITVLIQARKYEEAILEATKQIEKTNSSKFLRLRGIAYFNYGRIDSARRDFEHCIELNSSTKGEMNMFFGAINEKEKDFVGAFEHYSIAIHFDSTNCQYHMLRGVLCATRLKYYEVALNDFMFITVSKPDGDTLAKFYLDKLRKQDYKYFEEFYHRIDSVDFNNNVI